MKNKEADIHGLWQLISAHDDHRAFESLFCLMNASLVKFSMMYHHQREVAEDIVSDVFASCWINRKANRGIRNIKAYLFVAVKNQSLNYVKKYSQMVLVREEDSDAIRLTEPSTPEEVLEKKELYLKLDQSIAGLPQQCRIIFRLVKEEGIKYKEVAEILNISPRTVQTQVFRAMKKLNAVLAGYLDANPAPKDLLFSILLIVTLAKIYFQSL